ncbi:hypothetical protein BC937DRAFT_88078 [Endogone sp. FLAS-F59071]|nr:hypothetical protein BC937DRAFT_88078 [Endogone sp. FLAS-F59071]|eukprot:RUS19004.1 hypothetical protein BC937DRAFT_88078 [Endogone sp. FLAS-F59071]
MRRRTRSSLNTRSIALYAVIFSCFFATIVSADHVLRLDSLQRCDSTNDIKLTRFNMTYYKDNETIAIDLAGTSNFALNGTAHFNVLVFGSFIYQQDFPLCGTNLPQVCPIPNGPFNVTTWIPAPSSISSALPTFLFNLPDLGVQTRLSVSPLGGSPLYLCIVAGLTNSPASTNQNGTTTTFTFDNPYVTLVSALFCIVAFLTGFVSLVVAILYGADEGGSVVLTALALASPGLQDLVSYCQHIAYNAQFELAYPDFYRTFGDNFAWTLGLINSPSIQQAINDMRARYNGHPDQDPTYDSSTNSLPLGLGANSSAAGLARRAVEAAVANANVTVATPQNTTASGVEAYLYALRVPTADAFMTVLLVFLIILAALTIVMMIGWALVETEEASERVWVSVQWLCSAIDPNGLLLPPNLRLLPIYSLRLVALPHHRHHLHRVAPPYHLRRLFPDSPRRFHPPLNGHLSPPLWLPLLGLPHGRASILPHRGRLHYRKGNSDRTRPPELMDPGHREPARRGHLFPTAPDRATLLGDEGQRNAGGHLVCEGRGRRNPRAVRRSVGG